MTPRRGRGAATASSLITRGSRRRVSIRSGSLQRRLVFGCAGVKEGGELVDSDFTAEIPRKDGRKSHSPVTGQFEVAAVIDARSTRVEPGLKGFRDLKTESLGAHRAVLSNMVGQREEVGVC